MPSGSAALLLCHVVFHLEGNLCGIVLPHIFHEKKTNTKEPIGVCVSEEVV